MRKNLVRILPFFFILFLINAFIYAQGSVSHGQKNFLWKVQSETGTVYVLGSIHLLKEKIYPLNRKIEDSFAKSNILVVEANIDDIAQINLQGLMGNVFYSENETLEKHVSDETFELVKTEFEGLGIPHELIIKQKPWFLALTLTSLELIKLGFDPKYGIDRYFLSKATGKKKILELESLDYQINLFSTFSDQEQELFLLHTIKNLSVLEQQSDSIIHAWKSGNTESMESIISKSIVEDRETSSMYEKLLYKRNRNMASKIETFLKTDQTYFVVVGAGHLVGKKGIIEILKYKGFPVEQL